MSPPADGTNDAAAALLRSPETGALFRALPCGEMQSSDTTSHADKHTLELQEGLAGFDKIIEPTTTENPLSVGPREPSSTDLARGLNPEDQCVSPDPQSLPHLPDEHSRRSSFVESQSQSQVRPKIRNTLAAPSTVGTSTATPSDARGSEDIDDADTQPTSSIEADAVEDIKSEGTDTARACYDPDSERSNGSDSGSSSPTPTLSIEHQLSGVGAGIVSIRPPQNKDESDIALQPTNSQTRANETHGATSAFQPSTSETANQARERGTVSSQSQPFQFPGSKSRRKPHHVNDESEPPFAGTRSKASLDDKATSVSSFDHDLEGGHSKAESRNGSPSASFFHINLKVQHGSKRTRYVIMLIKGIVTVADLLSALVVGIEMHKRGSDILVVCGVVTMVLTVGIVILGAF